jgi:alpha-L-fucosidase
MRQTGTSYLFNVGPNADGAISTLANEILRCIGARYKVVQESVGDAIPI